MPYLQGSTSGNGCGLQSEPSVDSQESKFGGGESQGKILAKSQGPGDGTQISQHFLHALQCMDDELGSSWILWFSKQKSSQSLKWDYSNRKLRACHQNPPGMVLEI